MVTGCNEVEINQHISRALKTSICQWSVLDSLVISKSRAELRLVFFASVTFRSVSLHLCLQALSLNLLSQLTACACSRDGKVNGAWLIPTCWQGGRKALNESTWRIVKCPKAYIQGTSFLQNETVSLFLLFVCDYKYMIFI